MRPAKPSQSRHSLRGSKKLQAMMDKLATESSTESTGSANLERAGPIEADDKITPDEPEEAQEESEAFLSLELGKEHMSLKGRANETPEDDLSDIL